MKGRLSANRGEMVAALVLAVVTTIPATARYPVTIDPEAREVYLKASDSRSSLAFGNSVAVDGDTAVVGASGAEAVYVFRRIDGAWIEEARLPSPATGGPTSFGISLAVSGDTIVIGDDENSFEILDVAELPSMAYYAGAAYVYRREAGVWSQEAYLRASNAEPDCRFGRSVAISGDTIVVGAPEENRSPPWIDGPWSYYREYKSGAAYVFTRSAGVWTEQAYLKASNANSDDRFGCSVDVCGDTLVVGAYGESSAATEINGDQNDNSDVYNGAAYVFNRNEGVWAQEAYLKTSPGGTFGYQVGISDDTVAVSSNSSIYVFVRNEAGWIRQADLKDSYSGSRKFEIGLMALSGDLIVVGDTDGGGIFPQTKGIVYVFARNGGIWRQHSFISASESDSFDYFGKAVDVAGDTVMVGAPSEDSAARGVDGDATDNSVGSSGAAYLFMVTYEPQITVRNRLKLFGRTQLGKSSPGQTLVVHNSGTASLTGFRMYLSGPARRDFRLRGRPAESLARDASARVQIIFKPKRKGLRRATLTVAGNAPGHQVQLSGEGVAK